MTHSIAKKAGDAYLAAVIWVTNLLAHPFIPAVNWWHSAVSRLVNRVAGDEIYFEYDPFRNSYVVATEHPTNGADQYQVGHSAGKLASLLGLLPVGAGLFAAWLLPEVVFALMPAQQTVALISAGAALGIALFTGTAAMRAVFLAVEWQNTAAGGESA